MLPPGHIAAGFLTAELFLKVYQPQLDLSQSHKLYFWAIFFAFAPDLDNFYAFFKVRSFYYYHKDNSIHRRFLTHVPLFWLLGGLAVYFLADSAFYKSLGLIIWLSSWSHFLLDSLEYGVMWLWPFNLEPWALKDRGVKKQIDAPGFVNYWWVYAKIYARKITFFAEIAVIILALIVLII